MSLHPHHRPPKQSAPRRIEVVDPFDHPAADTPERLHETLFATRASITDVDTQLVSLLGRRLELARTLRAVVSETSGDPERALAAAAATEAARQGLPEQEVREVFARIETMSRTSGDDPA